MNSLLKMMMGTMAMQGTYEDRKVVEPYRDEGKKHFVSTCSVTDGVLEFETAIAHPEFNDGKLVIVEAYDSREKAEIGHADWIDKVTNDKLPDPLRDVDNAGIMGAPFDVPKRAAKPKAGAASV